jgi:hypothetical protein
VTFESWRGDDIRGFSFSSRRVLDEPNELTIKNNETHISTFATKTKES